MFCQTTTFSFGFHYFKELAVHLTSADLFHSNAPEYLNNLLPPIIILNLLMTKISYTGSCYVTVSPAALGEIISNIRALTLITRYHF